MNDQSFAPGGSFTWELLYRFAPPDWIFHNGDYFQITLLEEVIKKMQLLVDSQAGPWTPRSSFPAPLSLEGMWVKLMVPISSPDLSLEKVRYCWDHINLLRSLHKLSRFWQASTEIYWSCSTQNKPLSKFSCFLNMPSVNLEWYAYFSCLSLPSVYGGQLVNKHTLKGLLPFNCARESHLMTALCEGSFRAWH